MEQVLKKEKQIQAKPIMKWAGGKTQMLGDIMPKIPQKYGKYIEPFIGGGALFFAFLVPYMILLQPVPVPAKNSYILNEKYLLGFLYYTV